MARRKSEENEHKEFVSEEQMVTILDEVYGKVLNGIPKVSKSVDALADDYKKYDIPEVAAKKLINNQVLKCGTSGFVTGLGGLITLPITLPANVTSVLYVQMRMIAGVAKIGGFDIYSDQVQTLVYACLTGSAITDILKQAGIKVGEKFAVNALKKLPAQVLVKINQKVGFRLITKFGTKGVINIAKAVPVVGGVIGGVIDVASTKIIAKNAYNLFIKNMIPSDDSADTEEIFDVEYEDVSDDTPYSEKSDVESTDTCDAPNTSDFIDNE